jgi:hypothetical protein
MKSALLPYAIGVALAVVTYFPCTALAGPIEEFSKSIIEPEPPSKEPANIVNIRSSYVFESDFERGNGRFGKQDALNSLISYDRRFKISGNWYFRLGLGYSRFDFGTTSAPTPNHLQGAWGTVALEYLVNGETGFLFESRPGVYFENDINSDAFNAPTVLALAIPIVKDTFYLVAGMLYTGFGEYPVLPVAGASWKINERWKLSALFPYPRLIYTVTDSLKIWAGGELVGGAYRTDNARITPDKLRSAVVDYAEYRAGAGVTWVVCSGFELDAGAGWAFHREFDFHRAGEKYRLEGAPAVTLRGEATF